MQRLLWCKTCDSQNYKIVFTSFKWSKMAQCSFKILSNHNLSVYIRKPWTPSIWLFCHLTCACRRKCIHCGHGPAGQLLPVCVTRPGHCRSAMTASSCRTRHWCNGLGWKIHKARLWTLKWGQVVMCHGMQAGRISFQDYTRWFHYQVKCAA